MAHIGFETSKDKIEYQCGGSLISEFYVLTAAHCSKSKAIPVDPSIVRLNSLVPDDNKALKIKIVKFIKHENYNSISGYADIALIKLAEKVLISKNGIRPACLNTKKDLNAKRAWATGKKEI